MTDKQEEALKQINQHLKAIKETLNEHWGANTQFELNIIDKDNSPLRDFKEDIELKVKKLELSMK
jgi:hypothetical protein